MRDHECPRKLGDYVDIQRGTTYKSALLGQPGPVLLGLASIARNGGFRADNLKTYGGDSDPRILLDAGDLYVSLKDVTQSADLLGSVARVPRHIRKGRLTQDTVKLTAKGNDTPLDFLYWVLRTPHYREFCRAHATGTTNLGLPRGDFLAFPIPPLNDARQRLVGLLQALESKIDLNRRMNETLEAMARAIFKDWFVDFGPVRAKAEGRQPPGLAPDIAALFPDRLDDDDKPTGWERHSVKAGCVAVQNGGTPRRDEPSYWQPATIPWLTSGEVRKPYIVETENFISQAGFNSSSAKWVSADTTVVALYGATAGQVALLAAQLTTNQAVCALSPKPFYRYFNFVGLALSVDRLAQLSRGSAQQNLSKGIVEDFVMPPHEQTVLEAFDKVSAPIFSRIIANEREMRTLAALRDLLLPKLISGEIRIRDAERAMEDAA